MLLLANSSIVNSGLRYVPIPDAPTFNSPVTLNSTDTAVDGYIWYFDVGATLDNGGKDAILAGLWKTGATFNTCVGTIAKPFRFVNQDANTILGSNRLAVAHTDVSSTTNGSTHIEVYGKNLLAPWKVVSGESAMNFGATTAGAIYKVCNVVAKNMNYAGILTNIGLGGYSYKKVLNRFFRINGLSTEGEGGYHGHTSSPFSVLDEVILLHNHAKDKGRETFQIEHATKFLVYNCGGYNVGQVVGQAGQNNCVQIHDSNGTVENCIFDGAWYPFNNFAHGITFRNCYFRFTKGEAFIGRTDTSYFAGSPRLTGVKQLYVGCTFHFDNPTGTTTLVQVAERNCDIDFSGCTFSTRITGIYNDQRGATPPNSLLGTLTTRGNVTASTITLPVYRTTDFNNYAAYMCVTGSYYNRGMGYRTPVKGKLDICEVTECADVTVPYGTKFTGLTALTTTQKCTIQDGSQTNLALTWLVGSYTGVTGTYSIVANITVPSAYRNTTSIQAKCNVIVSPPPSTTKHIIVNLGGTAMGYVTSSNYNHIPQSFSTGQQTIKGENSGDTLTSLRKTDGTGYSGYQINIISQFTGEGLGQNTAGIYPASANLSEWTNPGSSGTSRSFKFTGLVSGRTYNLKIMNSAASFLSGAQTCDVTVTGGASGGTVTNFNEKANVNTTNNIQVRPTAAGEVTIAIKKRAGLSCVNVVEIIYEE